MFKNSYINCIIYFNTFSLTVVPRNEGERGRPNGSSNHSDGRIVGKERQSTCTALLERQLLPSAIPLFNCRCPTPPEPGLLLRGRLSPWYTPEPVGIFATIRPGVWKAIRKRQTACLSKEQVNRLNKIVFTLNEDKEGCLQKVPPFD